jgi:choline-glycine betaine transporter
MSELVDKISEIPGWTVVLMFALLVILLIGGRILDIMDMTTSGVENMVQNQGGFSLPNFGYRDIARFVWQAFTYLFAILFTVVVAVKISNALRHTGEA